MQSGNSLCLWALTRNPREKAFEIGDELGIFTFTAQTLVNSLRNVDYKRLKLAENNVTREVNIFLFGLFRVAAKYFFLQCLR